MRAKVALERGIGRYRFCEFYEGQKGKPGRNFNWGGGRETEKEGGGRHGLHNKNSNIRRLYSDLIGLQGPMLGLTHFGGLVPTSESTHTSESPSYWEHRKRFGMLVLSTVPWGTDKILADNASTVTARQGLSENPHTRQTQCLATTTYNPERPVTPLLSTEGLSCFQGTLSPAFA